MKKCPYCAELIQDEAILCRYCGKKLIDINKEIIQSDPVQLTPEISTSSDAFIVIPLKWHQAMWLRGLILGLIMGIMIFFYKFYLLLSEPSLNVGLINDAIMHGFTNIIIYFVIYLVFASIWRSIFKKVIEKDESKRRVILNIEFFFVIVCSFLLNFSLYEIDKLILGGSLSSIQEPTSVMMHNIDPSPTAVPTATVALVSPTKVLITEPPIASSPTKISKTGQEVTLKSILLSYKYLDSFKKNGWIMQSYIDGIDVEIKNSYVTLTLSKSPLSERDFKEVAYELIVITAYTTGAGPSPYGSTTPQNATDWNITGVKVISRNMADYTIVGYVNGHSNLAKMAESKDTRSMVVIEKYYE